MKSKIAILYPLLALFCASAELTAQQIYRQVNPDGTVTYTDQKPADSNAELVELSETIILPAVTVPSTPTIAAPTPQSESSTKQVRIQSPANESVFHGTDNRVTIAVAVSPAIEEGESLQLVQNGSTYGPTQTSSQWNLARLNPGAQFFNVRLLGSNGQMLDESDTVTIFIIP